MPSSPRASRRAARCCSSPIPVRNWACSGPTISPPTRPSRRPRSSELVDLDMPLLLYPFTDVIAFGADRSTVATAVRDAGRSMGVSVSPDPMPQESIFVRSDHYRFVTRGIPAILLMTGYANGGEAQWKNFLGQRLSHARATTSSQTIDWDRGGALRRPQLPHLAHPCRRRPAAVVVSRRLFRRSLSRPRRPARSANPDPATRRP